MQNLPPQLTPQTQSPMGGMPSRMPDMGAQMEGEGQMPDEGKDPEKIVAHFSPDELQDLDKILLELLQGIYKTQLPEDILFDPETGLRNYTPLDEILRNPEIEETFSSAISQEITKFAMGGKVEPGRPTDPELEKLRLEGQNGDTELAIITPFLLETFSKWGGREPDINPTTGLPQFGWFSSILRVVAPIAGAVFLGPVGAALGAGLATKLTGGSWGQSLGAGALGGLGAFAAPALGGMFQNAFPGASSALGAATRGIFGDNIGGALGNLFTPSTGGGVVSPLAKVGLGSVGKMIPGAASQAAGQAGIQAAGQTGGGGFLSSLMSGAGKALPLIGSGLLMAKGHKEDKKNLAEYQRALEGNEQKQRAETEATRERMGFNSKLNPIEDYRRKQVPTNLTQQEYQRGVEPRYFDTYAQGGAIKGDGKGQQDNIPKDIEENSYIIDASTVSDIGDGSTDGGFKELDRYFSQVPSHENMNESKGGYIKAMVSDGEYEISPDKVTAIGGGSNENGAKILKKFVEQVRSKKRTSGERLPPKSKPIGGYLKNIRHSAA